MKTLTTLLLLVLVSLVSAKTINVPDEQPTIQAGIDAAVDGDMVLVAEGTYVENINFKSKAITVASHYAVDLDSTHIVNTIIDGSGATHPDSASTVSFISGEDTTSVLKGFTITGGAGTLWEGPQEPIQLGGGIVCIESGATIVHNVIRDNTINQAGRIAEGAAIGAERGDSQAVVLVENNVIINNRSEATGKMAESAGIALYASGRIVHNVIKDNTLLTDTFGGPVAIGSGVTADFILIKDNIITDNESTVTNGDLNAAAVVVSATQTEICGNIISRNKIASLFATYGTGLYLLAADNAVVRNNTITHNSYNHAHSFSRGCFVYLGQDILIEHNTISDNDSTGGIYIHTASATIQHNVIQRNTQYGMAGIGGFAATVLIQNNLISHNNALDRGAGGGIGFIDAASALIQNNLVFKNHGRRGGGIGAWPSSQQVQHAHAIDTTPQLAHRTDALHLRTTRSSSIPNLGAVVLMNNTVVDNSAFQDGGGLYSRDWPFYVVNNIVWGNTGNDHPQIWDINNSAIVVYNSDIQGGWSGMAFDVMDKDPQLVGPLYHLSNGSPCIGMGLSDVNILGNMVSAPSSDFGDRVRPNPAGSHPDMGAWEHRLAQPAPSRILRVPMDFATIQGAINAAIDGDTVLVAEGTYLENINFKGKAITVASHYIVDQDTSHVSKTIIDGSQPSHPDTTSTVLFVSGEDTTSALMGLTITGGGGTIWIGPPGEMMCGGGIFCNRSGARIVKNTIRNNIIFSKNRTVEGAGIASEANGVDRLVIIEDNIIKDNRAESETANAEDGGLGIFSNCRIVGNIIMRNHVKAPEFSGAAALGIGQWDNMLVKDNIIQENLGSMSGENYAYAVVMVFDASVEFINNRVIANKNGGGKGVIGTALFSHSARMLMIKGNTFDGNIYNSNNFLAKAIYAYNSSGVLIEDNLICNGKGVGALYINQSEAVIRNNTIRDNRGYFGTGISGFDAKMLVENNIVANNTGDTGSGGGYLMNIKSALFRNNIFSNNSAGSRAAGGLAILKVETNQTAQMVVPELPLQRRLSERLTKTTTHASIPDLNSVVLINNTIVNNRAANYGGGLFVYDWPTFCYNTILWGNTAGTNGSQIWDPNKSMTVENCNIWGGWPDGTNIIQKAPLFVEDTFELSDASPCIGAGLASIQINGVDVTCGGQDCYGNVRPNPAGSDPDIGAYENERGDPFTDVMDITNALPKEFSLAQNYPNPFNPTTIIRYDLPQAGRVLITIYNVSGQYVRTLVDKEQNAGSHECLWDATDFRGRSVSSGLYFYRCQFIDSNGRKANRAERSMLLLK